jgi:hypothetical protein
VKDTPPVGHLRPPPHPRGAAPRESDRTAGRRRQAFKRAWEAKDIDALIGLLDPDATAVADGGGRALTFLDPIVGASKSHARGSKSPSTHLAAWRCLNAPSTVSRGW